MNGSESASFRDECLHCQRFELFNMINDALMLINSQNGHILFMNQQALDVYQYTSGESLRLSIGQISHNSAVAIYENVRLTKQYTNGYVFTANHIRRDGSIFKVEVSARYITMHEPHIFVLVVRPLTSSSKIREQIELAGKVQRRLLPRDLENHLFCIHSMYQPHHYVSGDLYDFVFDEEKQVLHGILIDVMGHGIAAITHTGILKYLFMQVKTKNIPVNKKLEWINQEVMPFFEKGGFAATFLFEFDFNRKILTYCSGGINHFIVIKGQGAEIIKAPGLFLGINEDEVFDQGVLHFQSGESFLFLTDGLFELLPKSISSTPDFKVMQEQCNTLVMNGKHHDDASSVAITIK